MDIRICASVVSINSVLTNTLCVTADLPTLTLAVGLTLINASV